MISRLIGGIPVWARRDHPVQRYQQRGETRARWQVRYGRALAVIVGLTMMGLIGGLIATRVFTVPAGQNPSESFYAIVYFPLIALQLLARIGATALTASVVSEEMRRQNWDNVRATVIGAELTLRARWAMVFYRLRPLLGLIFALRIILLGALLWDLASFQGRYLELLINGITPQSPEFLAIAALALVMTTALILPITGIGFDGAIGLTIAANAPSRAAVTILQGVWALVRIGVTAVLLYGAGQYLAGDLVLSDPAAWGIGFLALAMGDWGLGLLYLGRAGLIWATIPYSILFGVCLALFALAQAVLTDALVTFAARRAQKRG